MNQFQALGVSGMTRLTKIAVMHRLNPPNFGGM